MPDVTPEAPLSPDDRRRIGDRLRLARLTQRLDQQTLARQAEISVVTLALLERGAGRATKLETIAKVAKVLGTSVAELRVADPDVRMGLTPEDLAFAERFHAAPLNIRFAVNCLLTGDLQPHLRQTLAEIVSLLAMQRNEVQIRDLALIVREGSQPRPATKKTRRSR